MTVEAQAIDAAILNQCETEGSCYAGLARKGHKVSRSAPVNFGPAKRDAWLRGYDRTLAEIKTEAKAAKDQAVATLQRALMVAFPYWPDAADDPEAERADDQVKCQQALALLVGD